VFCYKTPLYFDIEGTFTHAFLDNQDKPQKHLQFGSVLRAKIFVLMVLIRVVNHQVVDDTEYVEHHGDAGE
jgi:hypothetical protein